MTMKRFLVVAILSMFLLNIPALGQMGTSGKAENEWDVGLFAGWLTGGSLARTTVNGEPVTAEHSDGLITGVRFGQDAEFLGWEGTAAGAFSDLDLKADPAANVDGSNCNFALFNVNALWYPSGNEFNDGRIRPFVTVGPGLAYLDTDFSEISNETMLDANLGLGCKFLLGDEGRTEFRIDYRWYWMIGSGVLKSDIFRQELSAGFGFRF